MSIPSASDRVVLAGLGASQRLSALEEQALQGLKGQDYERAYAQLMLQKQQETVNYVSKLLKGGGTTMTIINNMK